MKVFLIGFMMVLGASVATAETKEITTVECNVFEDSNFEEDMPEQKLIFGLNETQKERWVIQSVHIQNLEDEEGELELFYNESNKKTRIYGIHVLAEECRMNMLAYKTPEDATFGLSTGTCWSEDEEKLVFMHFLGATKMEVGNFFYSINQKGGRLSRAIKFEACKVLN